MISFYKQKIKVKYAKYFIFLLYIQFLDNYLWYMPTSSSTASILQRSNSYADSGKNLREFQCKCGRSYNMERHMKYHQKWECGKIQQCNNCYKQFNYRTLLIKHMRNCSF